MQIQASLLPSIRVFYGGSNRKGKALGTQPTTARAPEPVKRHAHYIAMLHRAQYRKSPFSVKSKETPLCPRCGERMVYRERCRRQEKTAGGDTWDYWISRYKCKPCQHTVRVLPDFLAPFKHYNVDIIMDVIDGRITSDDPEYEMYPCEQTMRRWKKWFLQNETFIGPPFPTLVGPLFPTLTSVYWNA